MGRYTTVQTFTDSDTKGAISYSDATTKSNGGGGGGSGKSSHYGPGDDAAPASSSGSGAARPGESKVAINRVDNVSGSTAGAGSGDFHMYRASRRRELERVERMEKEYAAKKTQEEFERKRLLNMTEFEARAHKRAEKRRRRKERTKARAHSNGSGSESDGDGEQPAHKKKKSTASSAPASVPSADADADTAAVLPETPGGVPEIPNDGSFLARMLAEQAKKKEMKKEQDQGDEKTEESK